MALSDRILKVTLSMPSGDVVLDESLSLHVRVFKAALAVQARATIDVVGMSQNLRQQLLTQFTAWNKRLVTTGQASQNYIALTIEAGYKANSDFQAQSVVIFKGEVVLVDPAGPPPNIATRITSFTRQVDRTQFISNPGPIQTTYKNYVLWAAQQMGFDSDHVICDTSQNDTVITNPASSIYVNSSLLIDIQDMYKGNVVAFVDDDMLIVKDRDKAINPSDVETINEFVGVPPTWNEWGVDFTTMFNPTIKLAGATAIVSKMNPGTNGTYVIHTLEYDLASRGNPFYVKASGAPPA